MDYFSSRSYLAYCRCFGRGCGSTPCAWKRKAYTCLITTHYVYVGAGRRVAERTKVAWTSHFRLRTNKSNAFHFLGKLPSNKEPARSFNERKRSKAGALINPNWWSHHHDSGHLLITFVISPFLLNVEASRIGIRFYSFFVTPAFGREQTLISAQWWMD